MALLSCRLNKGKVNAERLHWIGADVTAPTAPTNLTATAQSATAINLAWTAATDYYGIKNYRIERCQGAGCTGFALLATIAGTLTTYTDTTGKPSTTYRYRVIAIDPTGNTSAPSAIAQTATNDLVNVWLKVGGTWTLIGNYARVAGASITQALNEVADTASLRIDGTIPYALKGTEIRFTDATGALMFAGHITAVRAIYEGKVKNLAFDCDCIDYTWVLNALKVTKRFLSQTISQIINALVSEYAAPLGFTYDYSQLSNDVVLDEITFTNEEFSQAMSRTMERGGAYWYADYAKAIRIFNSANIPSAGTIDDTHPRQAVNIAKHDDYAAVATVIRARGGGAAAGTDATPGQTSLPIVDPAWYNASGGMVESGPQRFTYASVAGTSEGGSTIGAIQAPGAVGSGSPWGTFEPIAAQSSGTHLSPGLYWIGISNVSPSGETLIYQFSFNLVGPYNEIWLYPRTKPTDPKLTKFRVYATNAPGAAASTMGNIASADPATNTWTYDGTINGPTGSVPVTSGPRYTAPPTVNSAGETSIAIPAGATSVMVEDLTPFPAGGAWVMAPTGQIFRYTAKSAASGPGSLTGIPSSGIGSITAPIRSGTLKLAPSLEGIPTSGPDAIKYAIKTGDEVYIYVERSDATAIAALQAAMGYGDGKRYEFLTDGRLALAELTARADALLTMRKNPLITVTLDTRDPLVSVGKTLTFNVTKPAIVGTFLIQRVQISDMPARGVLGHVMPRRSVECSSRRFTFDDLVQQIKLLGRIN